VKAAREKDGKIKAAERPAQERKERTKAMILNRETEEIYV